MKQEWIIQKDWTTESEPKKYYVANDKTAQLIYHWETDREKADKFTFEEGKKLLEQLNQISKIAILAPYTIDVSDLNGLSDVTLRVITKTIQDFDPIKFSLRCEETFTTINQEAMITYSVNSSPMQTPQGIAMVFIATWQYWGNENEYKAWETELKRSKLLIKP